MSETNVSLRSAALRPRTANPETREVEATFATSTRARVYAPGVGLVWEELEISSQAMNLAALRAGDAPVLDAHNQAEARAVIGRVIGARIENNVAVARLKFSEASDVQPLFERIADGTLRHVSVGYRVGRHLRIGEQEGLPVLRAVEWTPLEISVVAIPADPGATIRAAACNLSQHEGNSNMSDNSAPADAGSMGGPDPRIAEIDAIALASGHVLRGDVLPLRARAVREGWGAEQFRAEVFAEAERAQRETLVSPVHTGGASFDNPEFLREAMAEALACRAGCGQPSGPAQRFMNLRMCDMAARLLEGRNVSTRGLSPDQILTRAHATSDFPTLLMATGNRILMEAFEPAASGVRRLVRMRTANDFRALNTVRAAGVDRLELVQEGGEITYGTAFEAAESYRVQSFARAINLSREVLINDDLGAFDTLRAIGRAAATTEAEVLVGLLTANNGAGPNLADGDPLFRTQRNNLASSGAAIDTATVSAGRLAMRSLQRDLNGVIISNVPTILLVGPAQETAAEAFLATITPATVGAVNPFSGRFELVVEPRLAGNAWYLFADPAQSPMFEMATLTATGGAPQIEAFTQPNVLGVTVRVVHDFGVGAVSPIGAWRNPGA